MFWTVVGIAVAALLLVGWVVDRRADRRRRAGASAAPLADSPRYGQGDPLGGTYGTFAPPPGGVNRGESAGSLESGTF